MFVSIMGSTNEEADAINGLESASGYIRRELGQRLRSKSVPELSFSIDPRDFGILPSMPARNR